MKNLFKRELNLHKQWLEGKPNGKQADFSSECLRGVDFSGCDLRQAIFDNAILVEANLAGAQLQKANFCNAILSKVNVKATRFNGANLSYVIMSSVNFDNTDINGINAQGINWSQSNLSGMCLSNLNLSNSIMIDTNLSCTIMDNCILDGSDLIRANLCASQLDHCIFHDCDMRYVNFMKTTFFNSEFKRCKIQGAIFNSSHATDCSFEDMIFDETTSGYTSVCPETGSFLGYVKVDNFIVVLKIPDDARRVSNTSQRCVADKAEVVRIENLDGTPANRLQVIGNHITYSLYTQITAKEFDEDRWLPFNRGLHFYMSRELAVQSR